MPLPWPPGIPLTFSHTSRPPPHPTPMCLHSQYPQATGSHSLFMLGEPQFSETYVPQEQPLAKERQVQGCEPPAPLSPMGRTPKQAISRYSLKTEPKSSAGLCLLSHTCLCFSWKQLLTGQLNTSLHSRSASRIGMDSF